MRDITFWIARQVFGVTDLNDAGSGGEPLFFWVQAFWLLIAAVIATAIWTVLDKRRSQYATLHEWFRLFVRFALAGAMFEYGMTKVIPTQFPPPSLETLVTPAGDLTLSALLWTSIGAAPAYEIFTGCIEVLGGILLILPRTTTLGALISMAAMLQVFVLNMTYDIGLKLVSFHLIVLAAFLLAPEIRRLVDFFVRNRPVAASTELAASRAVFAAQILFGVYLLGMYAYINVNFWKVAGSGSPRSAFYGIWNVEMLLVNGESIPSELQDYDRRWRRVIFDNPDKVTFQRTDDSFARYGASIDSAGRTLAITKSGSKNWKANFNVERQSTDRLVLEGEMDGLKIRTQLRLVEFDTLRLLNSRFRWVRPHEQ